MSFTNICAIIHKSWESNWLRCLLIVGIAGAFFPAAGIDYILPGIDASWQFIVNSAFINKLSFGDMICFTYGPLGFLAKTLPVAYNIQILLAVSTILFCLQVHLLSQLVFKAPLIHISNRRLLIAVFIVWVFHRYHMENILLFTVELAIAAAWFIPKKRQNVIIACLLIVILFFVKFTVAFACLAMLGIFWLILFFKNKIYWRGIWWIPFSIPLLFCIGYLLYNPSFYGLWRYVDMAMEISSGYSAAMSSMSSPIWRLILLWSIAIFGCLYCGVILIDKTRLPFFCIYLIPVGIAIKQALVRMDASHIGYAMEMFIPIIVLFVLFFPSVNKKQSVPAYAFLVVLLIWNIFYGIHIFPHIRQAKNIPRAVAQYMWPPRHIYDRLYAAYYLPDLIRNPLRKQPSIPPKLILRVGDEPTLIYPLQVADAAYYNLNLKVLPTLQAYSAYTPKLDAFCADLLLDDSKAPEYIIFDLDTIDYRWPLIEAPLFWNALYTHYKVSARESSFLLLHRNKHPQPFPLKPEKSEQVDLNQSISVPQSDHLVYVQMQFELNWKGKIAQLFYCIPSVWLKAEALNGDIFEGRCIVANLASPTLISFLPLSLDETAYFIETGKAANPITQISFTGPGLKYFKSPTSINWLYRLE